MYPTQYDTMAKASQAGGTCRVLAHSKFIWGLNFAHSPNAHAFTPRMQTSRSVVLSELLHHSDLTVGS